MSLRVGAGGAHRGCFFAFMQVAAVAAAPHHLAVLPENLAVVQILEEAAVALFVLLLGNRDLFEYDGNGFETFLPGCGRESGIDRGPLLVFSASRFSVVVPILPAG